METGGRARRVALGVLAVGFLLTACSASPAIVSSPDGRVIAVAGEATDASEEALAEGTAVWAGGCMALTTNGATYLVVFPYGTKIHGNEEVELPNGQMIAAGDVVALGGGFRSPARSSDLGAIPEGCVTEEIFWASGD